MPKKSMKIESGKVAASIEVIASHVKDTAQGLDMSSIESLIFAIFKADRIFIMGAGRSGLVARAFAMRLMHLGFNIYVVGETTTPSVGKKDLVIAISGSGETPSIVNLGRIAKELGAKLILVSSSRNSSLGKLSDVVVAVKGREQTKIEDYMERHMRGDYKSMAPLGTMFEITVLIILDGIIAQIMDITGATEGDLKQRHAVLE